MGEFAILAFDFEQFVLVLVAVAFSTWIVLPWAFFEKLKSDSEDEEDATKAKRASRHLIMLRDGESLLFVSGVFLMFYVLSSLAIQSTVADPFFTQMLPLMNILLALFGFLLLLGGLFDAVRVVNYFSELKTGQRDLLRLGATPLFMFNALLIAIQILTLGQYATTMHLLGWLYFGSLGLSALGVLLSIKWFDYVYILGEQLNPKGISTLVLLLLPYLTVFIYYYLFTHGCGIFSEGITCLH